ncbi:hypothetical protein ABH930_003704 [Kitasatospora sp. GAS204A]|nr:hypothetical protein [Kitasatospora sp. GAS204B]
MGVTLKGSASCPVPRNGEWRRPADGVDSARSTVRYWAAVYLTHEQLLSHARELARTKASCTLRRVGESAQGRGLYLLSVDRSGPDVLVVAGAHANEPVGMSTVLALAHRALEGPSGARWSFLLCLDPDGAVLNEGWLAGPLTMARHFEHFYRPPTDAQPEWLGDAPLPETAALLSVIEELRPALQCSLHGVDFGGAFVQLTEPIAGLREPFGVDPGVPLDVGSFDAPYWPMPYPGVYLRPAAGRPDAFDATPAVTERSTWLMPSGPTAVVEAPMWAVPAVADGAPHPEPQKALRVLAERLRTGFPDLAGVGGADPFARAAAENAAVGVALADEWEQSTWARTVAQVTALELAAERLPLRAAAGLARLGSSADRAGEVAERCRWIERRFAARWVPVHRQVALQARAVESIARAVLG